jgi:cytochrome P450
VTDCLLNIYKNDSTDFLQVGEKLDLDDPNLVKVVTLVNSLVRGPSPMNALTAILPFPEMGAWPIISHFTGFKQAHATFVAVFDLVSPYVEEHERTLDPDNIRDFLDLMLVEQRKTKDPTSCFNGKLGKATIVNSVIDLFIAGMESTASSIVLVVLHLLHHPDVQKKVHEEIDYVSMEASLSD